LEVHWGTRVPALEEMAEWKGSRGTSFRFEFRLFNHLLCDSGCAPNAPFPCSGSLPCYISRFKSLRFLLTNSKVPRDTKKLVAGVGEKKANVRTNRFLISFRAAVVVNFTYV
jgi:hypothetical protein